MRLPTLATASLLALALAAPASAQDFYLGQIFLTAATFCPRGAEEPHGQLKSVQANMALFSLLGTVYGGDGRTSFALPNLPPPQATNAPPNGPGGGPGLRWCIMVWGGVYPTRD